MTQQQVMRQHPNRARERRVLLTGALLGTMALALLTVIFGGEPFRPARDALGLSYFMADAEGVYADCSNPRNRNNRFCDRNRSLEQPVPVREPRTPQETLPFSLSD